MSDEEDFLGGIGGGGSSEEEEDKKKKEKEEEKKKKQEEGKKGSEAPKAEAKTEAPASGAVAGGARVGAVTDDFKPITLKPQKDQMGCIFAALVLYGDGDAPVEITSDKLSNILRAAKIDPNPFFPNLYAKVLKSVDIKDLIFSSAGGGGGPAVAVSGGASAPTAPAAEKKEEAKEEKKEKKEEKDEESQSIGGLFDDE